MGFALTGCITFSRKAGRLAFLRLWFLIHGEDDCGARLKNGSKDETMSSDQVFRTVTQSQSSVELLLLLVWVLAF